MPINSFFSSNTFSTYNASFKIINNKYTSNKINSRSQDIFFGVTKSFLNFPPLPAVYSEALFYRNTNLFFRQINGGIFLDDQFTEDGLYSSFNIKAKNIHISSHFDLRGDSAQDARLLIGNGKTLSVDVFLNNLNNLNGLETVVLAACDTANNFTVKNGYSGSKSFDGLATELIKKGANEVLATIWKVSDNSTAEFLKLFYFFKHIKKFSSSIALYEAQKIFYLRGSNLSLDEKNNLLQILGPDYLKNISSFSNPFHWAGFVLISS